MSKTSKNIILISVVVLLFGLLFVYGIFVSKTGSLPEDVIGNTTGNLNNGGLYAEYDGTVYFSNLYDDGKLYSMKADQTSIKKLSELKAEYINASKGYVFFFGKNTGNTSGFGSVLKKPNLVMLKSNGKMSVLTNEATQSMVLVGNKIYYQHYLESTGSDTYVYDLSKRKGTKLLDYLINPVNYYNGRIYFNGMYDDHYFYELNPETGATSVIWEGDIWFPDYDGQYVYYMDVRNNYRLCRYSPSANTIEVLTEERLDFFNVYDSVIYYQVSSQKNPRLMRMNKDGSNQVTVCEGIFSDVSCTSTYTYFSTYDSGYPIYSTPTFGNVNVVEFKPGVEKKK